MKKEFRVYQVNAFTSQMFRGNPAGVVINADGLADRQMQEIARELNNSETAFVFAPTDDSHDYQIRFFSPTMEVPICGHASISAAFIWNKKRSTPKKNFCQKTSIGTLPMEVVEKEEKEVIFMTQGEIEIGAVVEGELRNDLLAALGLQVEDVRDDLPIQSVSTGHGKVIIPLKDSQVLHQLTPNYSALIPLSETIGQNGFFPFAFDEHRTKVLTHARMFAPAIGINEDPVTGNGNGPLGAYLVHHQAVSFEGNRLEFISCQGEAMNRMGFAHVVVEGQPGAPRQIKVGGECVDVFQTTLTLELTNSSQVF